MTRPARVKVVVPFFGMDAGSCRVVERCLRVGQRIAVGEVVARVEGKDTTYEVVSPFAGQVCSLFVETGDSVQTGTPLASLEVADLSEYVMTLPDVGKDTPDAKLRKWMVRVGDEVQVGDSLAELETDKAYVEVPSLVEGTVLVLHAQPKDKVRVGAPLISFAVLGK